jgi:hypothetical protein
VKPLETALAYRCECLRGETSRFPRVCKRHQSTGCFLGGPGLDPKHLDRLFDAFYTTTPQGLGMGLAISRSIIEAHGWRLWATPNLPRGAAFQFTLPIREGNFFWGHHSCEKIWPSSRRAGQQIEDEHEQEHEHDSPDSGIWVQSTDIMPPSM